MVPHDGTGDELRKQRNEQSEIEGIFQGGPATAAHVDHIAHRLKGKKRDADRERDIGPLDLADAQGTTHRVELSDAEICVLEPAKNRDIGDNSPCDDAFSAVNFPRVERLLSG